MTALIENLSGGILLSRIIVIMFMAYCHLFSILDFLILDFLSEEGKGTVEVQYVLLTHFIEVQGHCHRIRNLLYFF